MGIYGHIGVCLGMFRGKLENCKIWKVGIWKSRKLIFFGKVKIRKVENWNIVKVEKWKI